MSDLILGEEMPTIDTGDDSAELPLPKKILDKLPEYIRMFGRPVLTEAGNIKFNLTLDDDFWLVFTRHYGLAHMPTNDQFCKALENEIRKALQ